MKICKATIFSLLLILVLGLGIASAEGIFEGGGRLQVSGNAIVTTAPDTARITLGVDTTSRSANEAATENARRMDAVLEALKNLALKDSTIASSGYNIYSYNDTIGRNTPDETMVTIYNVHNRITITTKSLDEVGKIVDVAIKAGANQVQEVYFDLADKEELRAQALDTAIKQAMMKAEVIAKSAGETLGGIVSISEEYGAYIAKNEAYGMMAGGFADSVGTNINPGEVEVSAQVTMVFWF